MGSVLLIFFSFCVVLLCAFTFRVPCPLRFLHKNDVRPYVQLFVGGLMWYLATHSVLCSVLCFSSSCLPYVANFAGLSILYCPFGIHYSLLIMCSSGFVMVLYEHIKARNCHLSI